MSDQLRDLVRPFDDVEPPLDLHNRITARERDLSGGRRPLTLPPMTLRIAAVAGVLLVIGALVIAAHSREQSKPRPAKSPPARHAVHYAGLPSVGAKASKPENDGRLILNISPSSGAIWHVYADGRIIWQRWSSSGDPLVIPKGADPLHTGDVQQWLTPQGAQLLRSRILAIAQPAGLFGRTISLGRESYGENHPQDWYQVLIGRRLIGVAVDSPSLFNNQPRMVTHGQVRALNRINALVANSTTRLPASAWKDTAIRPYVPSHYCAAFDRAPPDPAKLPSPARELLAQQRSLLQQADGTLTTDQARALFAAFADAGLKLVSNHAETVGWHVPTANNAPIRITVLRFWPGFAKGGC